MKVALIPARGGSKRLVNKNLLPIAGVPLLVRAIKTVERLVDQVYVSTENPTIASLAEHHGATVLKRPEHLAGDDVTVDQVAAYHFPQGPSRSENRAVLVYQPTMVGITQTDIKHMFNDARHPSALAVPIHGIWTDMHTRHDPRVNAQDAKVMQGAFSELGVRYYPSGVPADGSIRFIYPVTSVPVFDIDTPWDFAAAEAYLCRRHIVIRFAYSKTIGSGHYRRALTLAESLQHHNVYLHQARDMFSHTEDRVDIPEEFRDEGGIVPDLIINDTLDTTTEEMAELLRVAPVITFEDNGDGARIATAVVNDLYDSGYPRDEYTGHKYSILRPEFLARPPKPIADRTIPILVSFGGTDPNDLTTKAHSLLGSRAQYVHPPGSAIDYLFPTISGFMAPLLADTRLLITSAGRTVYEAAALGTPAMVISQNGREGTHTHLGTEWGNWNLGNHYFADWSRVKKAHKIPVEALQEMSETAYNRMDHKGLERVVALIESVLLEAR